MKARRKSEDNPNTRNQITILFCSKSLSIIRPDDFTDCLLGESAIRQDRR